MSQNASSSTSVPSPTKEFDAYLPHLTAALEGLNTHAAKLPPKSDLSFSRTLDRGFARDLDKASERVLAMTERLLSLVEVNDGSGNSKGKPPAIVKSKTKSARRRKMEEEDDVVDGYKSVVGVVDGLLEDADSCLDELNGQKKKAAIVVKPSLAAAAGQKLPGPFAKQRERIPQSIFNATNLPKPQLLFHDVPDPSSSTLWRSQLTSKPHAMVPLDFVPQLEYTLTADEEVDPQKEYYRREKEMKLRLHPYFYETRHLPYPTSMFIESPPIQPPSFEDQAYEYVDTPEQLESMVEKLKQAKEIAVDLEHHNTRSYAGFTCLMQISTREGDWVVDTLKLRKELREDKLGDVMTDPSIIKVFHGADSDIVWLQQDFDIYVVNLFDTYHASVVLKMEQRSLASLLQHYCNFVADKRYQRADWRIRPLPQGMLEYARSDTHFLLFIYDSLRNALLEQSSRPPSPDADGNPVVEVTRRNPQAAVREVLNRSADTALRLYEETLYDEENGKGAGGWAAQGRRWLPKNSIDEEPGYVWRKLHAWRDRVARELDESPVYIMPNDILLSLSTLQGTAPILVRQVLEGDRSPVGKARTIDIMKIIKQAKDEFAVVYDARIKAEEAAKAIIQDRIATKKAASAPTPSVIPPVPDFWDAITAPAPKATFSSKSTSSLFGPTIKSSASTSSSSSGPRTPQTSALFGNALKGKGKNAKKRAIRSSMSPGFAEVQKSIHGELEPKAVPTPVEADAAPIAPETVPFVPAAQRKTAPAKSEPLLAKETPTATPQVEQSVSNGVAKVEPIENAEPGDGVVQVKKSKKQKKRERVMSTSVSIDPSVNGEGIKKPKLENGDLSVSAEVEGESKTKSKSKKDKEKKEKKEKIKPEDIPTFDYTNEPNVLDQLDAAAPAPAKGKKDKKKKQQQPKVQRGIGAVEIPSFGVRPARDMSQPKAGNKSGTFV